MECGELVYAYVLSEIFKNNCKVAKALIECYVYPSEIFKASRRELSDIGLSNSQIDEISDKKNIINGEKELSWLQNNGVRLLFFNDICYPKRLKECPDAPILLFYIGTSDLNSQRVISIVGTRRCTQYGELCCREIVEELSTLKPPPIIVSGLAYGIDICTHNEALEHNLETVGVMATGIDKIYPPHHRGTAAAMIKQGGLITDFPRKTTPFPSNFVRRNRIIAALSDATIIIESAQRGGGVITAKLAASYSREVFAVPGRIDDPFSEGCNILIKENIASAVTSPNSITDALGWGKDGNKKNGREATFFEEDCEEKHKILVALSSNRIQDIDSLVQSTGIEMGELSLHLTELEMEGRIISNINRQYTLY